RFDDPAAAPALGTRRGEAERPLVLGHLAGSPTCRTGLDRRPRLGAGTSAVGAGRLPPHGHRGGRSLHRILEGEMELGGHVGTPAGSLTAPATAEHVAQA